MCNILNHFRLSSYQFYRLYFYSIFHSKFISQFFLSYFHHVFSLIFNFFSFSFFDIFINFKIQFCSYCETFRRFSENQLSANSCLVINLTVISIYFIILTQFQYDKSSVTLNLSIIHSFSINFDIIWV